MQVPAWLNSSLVVLHSEWEVTVYSGSMGEGCSTLFDDTVIADWLMTIADHIQWLQMLLEN